MNINCETEPVKLVADKLTNKYEIFFYDASSDSEAPNFIENKTTGEEKDDCSLKIVEGDNDNSLNKDSTEARKCEDDKVRTYVIESRNKTFYNF